MNTQLPQIRKHVVNYWSSRLLQSWLHVTIFTRRFCAWTSGAVVGLLGCSIAASVLFTPQLRTTADAFQPLEAILSQLGATYGTILALVLTLSIIPIQRAGEVWSPSIIRLYRQNPATYITFVTLGIFCLVSFLFAIRGLAGMPASIVLAFSLAILGISFDVLRWYHGHVCQLLDPTYAVGLALKQVKRVIDETNANVTRVARLQHQLLSSAQQSQFSSYDIESAVYPRFPGHPDSINSWINDLAEITIKAVARGEKFLAKAAIFAIAELTIHYLSSRKHNLTLTPSPDAMFLAMTSDVNLVTDRAYETLQEVSRVAAVQNDEATAIHVSEAYQKIAIHTANLEAHAFREHTAPLTFGPIYYAFASVKFAQTKGLDEVAFQSAAILSRIPRVVPKDVAETDILIPIIDGLFDIALYLYGKRSHTLAEEVNGHYFTILAHMLQQDDYYFKDTLRHVLEKIGDLAPFAILNEAMAGRLSMVHPLGKAYGLINQTSLGYIFDQAAATLPKVEVNREWINPYHDLIVITEIIADHLRKIAENNEFGESFLIWEIDHLIKHIAVAIGKLIDQPLRIDHGDESELIDKFLWILAFYWVAFNGKKSISKVRADDCCDSLVFVGLLFFERGHPEVLRENISNIKSILNSYCEIAQPLDYYAIGDMLAHLWGIRMILVARNNVALIQEVDRAQNTKPVSLTYEQWQGAQNAILLRRGQLEERLAEGAGRLRSDSTEAILFRLLQGRA